MYSLVNSTILTGPLNAAALAAEVNKLAAARAGGNAVAIATEQAAVSNLLSSIANNDNVYQIYADCTWSTNCANNQAVPPIDPCDAQPGSICGECTVPYAGWASCANVNNFNPSRPGDFPHCTTYPGGPACTSGSVSYDAVYYDDTHTVSYITTYPSCRSVTYGYKVPRIMRLQAFASDGEVLAGTYLQLEFQSNPNVPHPTGAGGCNAVGEATAQAVTGTALGAIAAVLSFSVVLAPIGAIVAFWAGVIPAVIGVVCAAVAPQ